jgi:hypothetical protein
MIGVLAKSGLSASDAMPALQFAMKKAAKDGKDAGTVFKETFETVKNAPNDIVATQAAVETFGGRAGPKFAALIREGKLSWDDFKASIAQGDTIKQSADDVSTYQGALEKFKHIIQNDLEPAATKLFSSLGDVVKSLKPVVETFGAALGVVANIIAAIPGPVLGIIAAFVTLTGVILVVQKVFSGISAAWSALSAVFAINPVVLALIAIVAIIALVIWKWDAIKEAVGKAWDWVVEKTGAAWNWLKGFFQRFWPEILAIISGPIGIIVLLVVKNWDTIKEKTAMAWNWIRDHIVAIWETVRLWVSDKVAAIRDGISNAFSAVRDRLVLILEAIKNVVLAPFRWIADRAHDVKNAVGTIGDKFENIRDRMGGAILGAIGFVSNFVDTVKRKLGELKDWIAQNLGKILGPFSGIVNSVGGFLGRVFGGGRALGGQVDAGEPVLVGERGPEVVTFGAPGSVTSATATRRLLEGVVGARGAGGGGVTVNGPLVEFSGDVSLRSDQDITDLSRELAKEINRTARAKGTAIPLTGAVA